MWLCIRREVIDSYLNGCFLGVDVFVLSAVCTREESLLWTGSFGDLFLRLFLSHVEKAL